MSQLVLILPGATDFELQGRIHGDLDLPLCAEGQAEVERVGRELQDLGIEVLYTSTCEWARQSADSLGKLLQVKVKKLDNLQNLDHGLWQGMLIEEVRQKQPTVYRQWQEQPETLCPPEGETIDHARTRVAAVLTKVLKKHKDGVIGLVVPEPLASVIRDFRRHRRSPHRYDEERNEWLEADDRRAERKGLRPGRRRRHCRRRDPRRSITR